MILFGVILIVAFGFVELSTDSKDLKEFSAWIMLIGLILFIIGVIRAINF